MMTKTLKLDKYIRICLWITFVATVAGANWALVTFGIVSVGLGFTAPAGVYFAGISFTLRDLLHERGGRLSVLSAIAAGAILSSLLDQRFALASGIAFLVSELADWAIYAPLRHKGWTLAVASSNFLGLLVDSVLFLSIAFGSIQFIEGQIVGKAYMTIGAIIVIWSVRYIKFNKLAKRILRGFRTSANFL